MNGEPYSIIRHRCGGPIVRGERGVRYCYRCGAIARELMTATDREGVTAMSERVQITVAYKPWNASRGHRNRPLYSLDADQFAEVRRQVAEEVRRREVQTLTVMLLEQREGVA